MSGMELCLNRVTKPQLPLGEFLKLSAELGIHLVEVRNDFTEIGILDGLSDAELKQAFRDTGTKAVTINALYPFEYGPALKANLDKLKFMIQEAKRIDCPMIVMCPYNEPGDARTPAQRATDLVAALNAYGPLFKAAGMTGLIEVLGFEVSALRTKKAALAGIAKCDYPECYKLLHDTFHHYLAGETEFFPKETAVIHVSGVYQGKAKRDITDDDRMLVDPDDIMDNRGQLAALKAGGCTAPISYEPFGAAVRAMEVPVLKTKLKESIKYLLG
jgi:2-keto-myo-inositol isomerase